MKKIILFFSFLSIVLLYALEDASTTLSNMKMRLENDKSSLYKVQTVLKNDIYKQKQELEKIENGLDIVLDGLRIFSSSFNGCHNDYKDSIEGFRKIRDDNVKRYSHRKEELDNMYYEDIEDAKNDLKRCLSSKGDFLAELQGLKTKLKDMKEQIDISKNSIPRLEKRLKEVNKKILRITIEINGLEGKLK